MIHIDDLSLSFGDTLVLDSLSLAVPDGELMALVGPNGAGKTTLLRAVNGILTPETGSIHINGHAIQSMSAAAVSRLVATVPQNTSVAFDFSVREVVAMGRTPYRSRFSQQTDANRRAIKHALERTETAQFADRLISELSGGQRQRVLIARALAQETPVLVLDEPTANLDINHQLSALSLARELVSEGKTIVAAIHDLDLAARFCDTVTLLADGNIIASGPPSDVFDAEYLEPAFNIRTAVSTNPTTGTPSVTPLADEPPTEYTVHVIGTGQETAHVIGQLIDAGIRVTAGVLPAGGSSAAIAAALCEKAVITQPFNTIPESDRKEAISLVSTADVTILTSPVDDVNRHIAAQSRGLYALPGTNPPSGATTIQAKSVISTLRGDLPRVSDL